MATIKLLLLNIFAAMLLGGCASLSSTSESREGLVGAWIVTASRPAGVAKVSTRDLQDKEIGMSESRLEGKRIQVEPF
jgi:uncharacterized protein YceK